MCGRFALSVSPRELARQFNLPGLPKVVPRFNIAPGQRVAAVRLNREKNENELAELLWRLIPAWSKTKDIKYPTFNAVSETAAEKPSFRAAFKQGRRCLIPASGFYEWKGPKGDKQPYYIQVENERAFAMAGLWERWEGGEEVIESCTILTTAANELIRPIHEKNRMPVILAAMDYEKWLDPGTDLNTVQGLCRSFPSGRMSAHQVSRLVNSVKNDLPECAAPLAG